MAVLRLKQSPRSATSRRRVSESNIRSLGAADGRDPRPNLDDFDSAALACGNQPTREPHGIVRATVENGLDLPSDAIDRRKDSHLGLGGRRMAFQILELGATLAGLVVNLAGLSKSTAAADIAHGGC